MSIIWSLIVEEKEKGLLQKEKGLLIIKQKEELLVKR